jgi:hypothetical protein
MGFKGMTGVEGTTKWFCLQGRDRASSETAGEPAKASRPTSHRGSERKRNCAGAPRDDAWAQPGRGTWLFRPFLACLATQHTGLRWGAARFRFSLVGRTASTAGESGCVPSTTSLTGVLPLARENAPARRPWKNCQAQIQGRQPSADHSRCDARLWAQHLLARVSRC